MDEVAVLLEEIAKKYEQPQIDYFGRGDWRVWVRGFHIHGGSGVVSYGSFAESGVSLKSAAENLLKAGKLHPVVRGDNCDGSCPHFSDTPY